MCTIFGNNKCITSQIIQYTNFSSFTFEKCAAAAAAIVQLQQQYLYKPIQNVKLLIYTRFCDNKWIYINNYSICSCSCNCSCSCYDAAAGLQLQQQHPFESIQNVKQTLCTKYSDSKQIISQIIQLLLILASYLIKVLQLQQQQQHQQIF